MTTGDTDRNLLYGFLALQNDFISREDLIASVSVWLQDKSRPLDEILSDRGALRPNERQLVAALVQVHLERHDNDSEKSLAALSSVGSVRDELQQLGDGDIDESMSRTSGTSSEYQSDATLTVGKSTSEGRRFRLLRPHAKGGLGEVFVAEDIELHREVALKEIQQHHADSSDSRTRFVLEAEITGGLEHPGIVPVYGLGQYADGRPYYAMRFIRGDSLKEAIEQFHKTFGGADPVQFITGDGAVEFRKLLGRFIDVCDAIQYAHSRGVLHRDLKPGNIMLGRYGETLVVDWGLAKALHQSSESKTVDEPVLRPPSGSSSAPTQFGSAIGTPTYMSPEQAAGRLDQLGPATDVYSLGATLYCLLTGQPPVEGDDVAATLRKVQQGSVDPPRQVNRHVPQALEAICLKAMALNSEDRYGSPHALAEDIEKWLADEPISAFQEPLSARVVRWTRRHKPTVAGAATLLVTATIALTIGVILLGEKQGEIVAERNAAIDARDEAAEERRRTEQAKEDAEKLITFMLGDLRERLKPIGRLDVMTDIGRVVADYYEQQQKGEGDRDSAVRYSQALGILSEIASEIGLHDHALKLNEERNHLVQKFALTPTESEFSNTTSSVNLQHEVVDILRQSAGIRMDLKDVADASKAYQLSVESLEQAIAAGEGQDSDHLKMASLLASYSLALVQQGNERAAREQLFSAMNHLTKVSGIESDEKSLVEISVLLQCDQLGIPEDQISFELVDHSPRATAENRLKAITTEKPEDYALKFKTADLLHRLSPDVRGEAYFVADQFMEELVSRDPSNQRWRELRAEIQVVIGYELIQLGRREQAHPYLQSGLETLQELAALQPDNPRVLHRLAKAYRFIGWWEFLTAAARGERSFPQAQRSFHRGIETIRPLVEQDHQDAGLAVTYTFLHIWLAEALRDPHDKAYAIFPVLELIDKFGERLPADEAVQNTRFQAHDRLSDFLSKIGRLEEAEHHNNLARAGLRKYQAAAGPNARLRRLVAQGWRTRIRVLQRMKKNELAYEAIRESLPAYAHLVRKPELHARSTYLSGMCSMLGVLLNHPQFDPATDFALFRQHAELVSDFLAEFESADTNLVKNVAELCGLWQLAAARVGPMQVETCWIEFLDTSRSALQIDVLSADALHMLRKESLGRIANSTQLLQFLRKENRFEEVLDEAIAYGRDAVEFDPEDISSWKLLSHVYHLKAEWYRESEQAEQAEQLCQLYEQSSQQAVELSGRQFTQQNWEHYATHHLLGHALISLKKFKDAEPILLEGFEGLDRLSADIPSSERADFKTTATRLIELYRKWGKQAELQRWQQTAKRVR